MTAQTTLLTVTEDGGVELETDDDAVMHKARAAFRDGDSKTFVYVTPTEELTVTGRVTEVQEIGQFRFTVLPQQA